jgi:hypothetical protein
MYNIFKPHVVLNENNERYYVRKFTVFGWLYKDKDSQFWWTRSNDWSGHESLESAIKSCNAKFKKVYP